MKISDTAVLQAVHRRELSLLRQAREKHKTRLSSQCMPCRDSDFHGSMFNDRIMAKAFFKNFKNPAVFYGTANILSALHGRRKLLENNCLYQSLSRTFHPLPKYTREARERSPAKSIRTNRTASRNTAALLLQNKNSRIFLMRSDSY